MSIKYPWPWLCLVFFIAETLSVLFLWETNKQNQTPKPTFILSGFGERQSSMSVKRGKGFRDLIFANQLSLFPFPSGGTWCHTPEPSEVSIDSSDWVLPCPTASLLPSSLECVKSVPLMLSTFQNVTVLSSRPHLCGFKSFQNDLSVQVSSVAQSCPTLCDPMDCSMPGFPDHHQLPELAQTHAHWVDDALEKFF